jgi:cyclohexanecarboxylate-CoA ligase
VCSGADVLRAAGVTAGDPVIVQLRNSCAYAIADVAISALGGVLVPVKTSMDTGELEAVAGRVRARTMVLAGEFASRMEKSAELGIAVVSDAQLWTETDTASEASWQPSDSAADPDDPLNIMFSSGTTGVPKGIMNTTNTQLCSVRAMNEELGLGAGDPWLIVPPMAHNAGWLYSFMPGLLSGAPMVFQERFDPYGTLRLLIDHAVHGVFLTPTHAVDVLGALAGGADAPGELRYIIIGGAATPPEMKASLRSALGAEVIAMYGSTENQGATFIRPGSDVTRSDLTVGWPCATNDVAIIDVDRHTLLPVNEVGEIATRGASTFAGYFDDQSATDAAFNDDGWFLTGDLGYLDSAGALRMTGRRKELIIRGGLNIAPDDVELALAEHPALDRVAAVGVPDERLGERVCAVVVTQGEVGLASLTDFLRARGVGTHLWPEALLRVETFPQTDIGKIQRGQLRDLVLAAVESGTLEYKDDPTGDE